MKIFLTDICHLYLPRCIMEYIFIENQLIIIIIAATS